MSIEDPGYPPSKPDQSVPLSAIRALVQQWEKEIAGYESGVTLPTPVGDMNYASASTARKILAQLAALCPAPPEDQV
jgi:hypothetical protein